MTADGRRFTIRWDGYHGYRVSTPSLQEAEVVVAAEYDALRAENEALRKIIPSKYDLGAAIYYLESHELRCKYDKGTSDATRAEIHRLIDDLKVFRHAVHMPDATAVAFDENGESDG